MNEIFDQNGRLLIDLYHGTSTLFLDSIIANGLGAVNPIRKWGVLELAREVGYLSDQYLQETQLYKVSSFSFKKMVEQSNEGAFNFQHGDTYLSPAPETACRYAIRKEYGSEVLTYTLRFLKELLQKEIKYVESDLFMKYREVYGLIEAKPSPLLIKVKGISTDALLSEHGDSPKENYEQLRNFAQMGLGLFEELSQQTNFRLCKPVSSDNLKFYIVNVRRWDALFPDYNLYQIQPVPEV